MNDTKRELDRMIVEIYSTQQTIKTLVEYLGILLIKFNTKLDNIKT